MSGKFKPEQVVSFTGIPILRKTKCVSNRRPARNTKLKKDESKMQQIYGKPIYDLLEECAYQLDEKLGSFRERDIREWFEKNYPKIKKTTLSAQIRLCTANSYSRLEAWPDTNFRNKKGDVFWKISRGVYVKYVSEKHGQPDYLK